MECCEEQNKWEGRLKIRAAILAAAAFAASPLQAQTWPSRTITLVVPFAAGGGTDAIGRVIAEKLAARLGQPVVVENKAGAASAIGTAYVGKASPDGYTLLMTTNSAMVILPLTQPPGSLNYDRNDFSMIGLTGILPNLLIVSPKVPVNSVSELIAYAKARPGQLSFASSGNGTITHLIGELFKARTGIDVVHVPYRTGVQSAPDVMEGRVQYIFDNIIWSLPMIRAGQLKGLAITTSQRSTLAPDIPTVAESGVPGFEGITWLGLAAPAKTPEPVIARLGDRAQSGARRQGNHREARLDRRRAARRTWAGRHARDARRGPRPLEGHSQRRKDQAAMNFHELCKTERPLILPGAFDAMSARLIKRAGFKAYFTGGFPTIGARWGLPDIGLVALGEISAAVTDIMAASDLPVMVDGDNGYGDVKNVVHVLHTYERLGVSAIMFEDQVAPKRCGHIAGKDVIPAAEMAAKIKAASQSKINRDTFILARTDARDVLGLDEAFRRAELYLKQWRGRHLHRVAARRRRAGDHRQEIRRAADGQHAGRRPHADPDAAKNLPTWASRSRSTASRC